MSHIKRKEYSYTWVHISARPSLLGAPTEQLQEGRLPGMAMKNSTHNYRASHQHCCCVWHCTCSFWHWMRCRRRGVRGSWNKTWESLQCSAKSNRKMLESHKSRLEARFGRKFCNGYGNIHWHDADGVSHAVPRRLHWYSCFQHHTHALPENLQ